jgi:hypothetical protein
MELKKCNKCGKDKPKEEFHKHSTAPDGKQHSCKACRKKCASKYYLNNKERITATAKEYRRKNKKRIYEHRKEWYQKNKESVRVKNAKCRQSNKEYSATYKRERRRNDPVFRITSSMGTGMWICLKGLRKNSRTFSYIDKSPEELMNYLEKQFTEGMSRENYGEWHVDHIRPLASFEFDKYKEGSAEFEALLGEAWHYTNLQPLWATDNISKGAKWGPAEKD